MCVVTGPLAGAGPDAEECDPLECVVTGAPELDGEPMTAADPLECVETGPAAPAEVPLAARAPLAWVVTPPAPDADAAPCEPLALVLVWPRPGRTPSASPGGLTRVRPPARGARHGWCGGSPAFELRQRDSGLPESPRWSPGWPQRNAASPPAASAAIAAAVGSVFFACASASGSWVAGLCPRPLQALPSAGKDSAKPTVFLASGQRSLYACVDLAPWVPDQTPGGSDGIVIAGGGLAAQRCAESLRRNGYDRAIRIVCAEARRPYDRPPLSKQVLTGSYLEESLAYRSGEWYEQHSIDLLLGVRATGLCPHEQRLRLSHGVTLRYERLLVATGSRPRTLPMLAGYDNVSVLRTFDDATALRDVLAGRPRLVVIGAGFIGQEVGAAARKLGARSR